MASKQFLVDIKKELQEKAENFVINCCGDFFEKLLMCGPYKVKMTKKEWGLKAISNSNKNKKNKKKSKINKSESEEEEIKDEINEEEPIDETDFKFMDIEVPRVVTFVFDKNKDITYGIALNQNGEKVDQKTFKFNYKKPNNNLQLNKYENNFFTEDNACKNFIEKNDPNLILIGANNLKCRNIKKKIDTIIHPDSKDNSFSIKHYIYVTFGDLSIPEIYSNSPLSDIQSDSSNIFIKQAISLGRYWQSPLDEILQLWSPNINENLCLKIKMHPLQKYVNQKKLMEKLEFLAVKVVNQVGFDLNSALEFSHKRKSLMFISGFGPKKAKAFISKINTLEKPITREGILEEKKIGIGKKLAKSFINFIKIKTNIKEKNIYNGDYNLLDMTRIPLESYQMTEKLIDEVFKKEKGNINKNQKKSFGDKIEEIILHPELLNSLDINEYINKQKEELESTEFEHLKFTFKLIKEELTSPFHDPREDEIELSPQQIFHLLTGDEKFERGVISIAKVIRIDSEKQYIECILPNGLSGTLWFQGIYEGDEKEQKEYIEAMFKPGMTFEARVKKIDYNKFRATLTNNPQDMSSHKKYIPNPEKIESFFDLVDEDILNMPYINAQSQKNMKYQPRNIKHERFRNITYNECYYFLENKDIGECYFRPSSIGNNNLTLSYKFYNQIICHLDIVEEDKKSWENIGRKLRIGNETYSSLDDIIKRYVNPCSELIKESIKSKEFVHCETKSDFDYVLNEEKKKHYNIINYNFSILKEYPGYLVLGYISNANPHYEYIKIKPKGLYFHDKYFTSLDGEDGIVKFFKKEYSTKEYRKYISKEETPMIQYNLSLESNDNFNNDTIKLDEKSDNRFGVSGFNNNSSLNTDLRKGKKDNTCYLCHKPGHISKNCPEKNNSYYNDKRRGRRDRNNNDNYIGGKRRRDKDNKDNNGEHGFKKTKHDK